MALFENNKEQLNYLDEERKKLWERIADVETTMESIRDEINHKSSDSEKEAKVHSKKAAEFRNKTEARLEEASDFLDSINIELEKSKTILEQVGTVKEKATNSLEEIQLSLGKVEELESSYNEKLEKLDSHIVSIESFFGKYPDLDKELSDVDEFVQKIEENKKKSSLTLSEINKKKTDLDELYLDIFGYEDTDEEGSVINVDGLKDKLEESYEKLEGQIDDSSKAIEEIKTESINNFKEFESDYKDEYNKINNEIKKLLPNALTAGLSAAFSNKKKEEEDSAISHRNQFNIGIAILIIVSVIPVALSIIFIVDNVPLEEVLNRLPRMVLAILPIYIPAFWVAHSASKKLNLSKRLIEEYSHKEVLSKTYEGLSTQISNIDDTAESEALRIKLLSNFLQVSSENPGKLISNYESTDHPIMEALEQSYKLQLALDKLGDIPGIGKVTAILEKKAKQKLEEKAEKTNKALEEEEDN